MLTNQLPFPRLHECAVLLKVVTERSEQLRYQRPHCEGIADTVWILLQACWKTDPKQRPSASCLALVLDLIYGCTTEDKFSAQSVLALIYWMQGRTSSKRSGDVSDLCPYPCKWPDCHESFETIGHCIEHECSEFLNWRVSSCNNTTIL